MAKKGQKIRKKIPKEGRPSPLLISIPSEKKWLRPFLRKKEAGYIGMLRQVRVMHDWCVRSGSDMDYILQSQNIMIQWFKILILRELLNSANGQFRPTEFVELYSDLFPRDLCMSTREMYVCLRIAVETIRFYTKCDTEEATTDHGRVREALLSSGLTMGDITLKSRFLL